MGDPVEQTDNVNFPKPEDVKDIHQAINAIMKRVEYVQKQKSTKLSYTFAGEAALISAIRPWMVEYGVILYILNVEDFREREYTTGGGTGMLDIILKMTGRFVHAPSDTYIDVVSYGQGADAGDKSANKASTGAFKYLLRQTFVIETGDDPDNTADNERGSKSQPSGQGHSGNGNGQNKPADKLDLKGWPEKVIQDVAKEFGVKPDQVVKRLEGCKLAKTSPQEDLVNWIKYYKASIAGGGTEAEAVEATNKALVPMGEPDASKKEPF